MTGAARTGVMTHRAGADSLTGWACLIVLGTAFAAPALAQESTFTIDSTVVVDAGHGGPALANPGSVAFDIPGREVVVANTAAGRVEFFDWTGRSTGGFVHLVPGEDGALARGMPIHVATLADGRVLVTDARSAALDVCDYRGRLEQRIALPAPDDDLARGGAGALAVLPDGSVLVASRGTSGRVYAFDPALRLTGSWGDSGSAPGQLSVITALAVTAEGERVVACLSTELGVQVFDAQGRYLRGFGIHDVGPGRFSHPSGIAVTSDGRLWVADEARGNIQVFDPTGALVDVIASPRAREWLYPSALATNGQGMFALTEMWGNRLNLMWVR